MERFINIEYISESDQPLIQVHIRQNPLRIYLSANHDGMAVIAEIASDFLTAQVPEDIAYRIDASLGLHEGSPNLIFEFDGSLDEKEPGEIGVH